MSQTLEEFVNSWLVGKPVDGLDIYALAQAVAAFLLYSEPDKDVETVRRALKWFCPNPADDKIQSEALAALDRKHLKAQALKKVVAEMDERRRTEQKI